MRASKLLAAVLLFASQAVSAGEPKALCFWRVPGSDQWIDLLQVSEITLQNKGDKYWIRITAGSAVAIVYVPTPIGSTNYYVDLIEKAAGNCKYGR